MGVIVHAAVLKVYSKVTFLYRIPYVDAKLEATECSAGFLIFLF